MNLNKAFVLGNVTRDPEVRMLPSGQQVTNFGLATNRYYTDGSGQKKSEAEFHNIVCFGKLADISSQYLKKGSLVLIEGRIKTRNWESQQGIKQYRTEIIADALQLGPKGTGGGNTTRTADFASTKNEDKKTDIDDIPVIEENYPPPSQNISKDDNGEIDVKDIPF